MFELRGVLEAFYGRPWSWHERHRMLECMAAQGFNAYLYGPKNDPVHRNRWREPYTNSEWREFGRLTAHARELGIDFIFGLSALAFTYSDDADLNVLLEKLRLARERGIQSFALLLDDIPAKFEHSEDARRFPTLAQAQAWLANTLAAGAPGTYYFVPTEYHGDGESDYLRALGEHLDPRIRVFWTGREICSPTIAVTDLEHVNACLGRRVTLWDNVPVNDLDMHFDPHLGPLSGREVGLAAVTDGYFAAPGPQAEASKITLYTTAAYLRDPAGYDPQRASREAAAAACCTAVEAEALLLLADLARRGPLNPGAGLHHSLWPAIDAFWLARGGAPALAGPELEGRPRPTPVEPDEQPLREAAVRMALAAETLLHLQNLELRRELAPWSQKLAGWARVLKYALGALDHTHDARAREYVLEELALVRANFHWVAGDTFDQFARRCVWLAEKLAREGES